MQKTNKSKPAKPVLVRLPELLLRRVDLSAKVQQRSRAAEISIRLAATFKPKKNEVAA